MPPSSYPLLTALFAPHPAESFLREHWPSRPLQAHGPLERLPAALRDPMLASAAEFAQRYKGPMRFTHGRTERQVNIADANAVSLLDMGLTICFVGLVDTLPNANPFLRQLESELGLLAGTVTMSAFAASDDSGVTCHFDNSDLISVQLAGRKRFHYSTAPAVPGNTGGQYVAGTAPFDDLYAELDGAFPDPATAQFECAEMAPGSVLFLPRGTWHYTEGQESFSISILSDAPNGLRCVLDQLRLLLLQDPCWRQPLIGGFGDGPRDAQTRAHVAQLLAALPEIARRLSPDDVLAAPAQAPFRLQRLSPASRFQRTPYARLQFGAPGAGGAVPVSFVVAVTRKLGGALAQVEASPAAVSMLRWIEARDSMFAASELAAAMPGEPFAAIRQVLELCVQAQFVRLLWFPALRD